MLRSTQACVAPSGHTVCCSTGKIFVAHEENPFLVDIIEASTGLLEKSVRMLAHFDGASLPTLCGFSSCGSRFLLGYDSYQGYFSVYNLKRNSAICSLWVDPTENVKARSRKRSGAVSSVIRCVCGSRERDGMFFFSYWGDTYLHALLISETSGCISSPIQIHGAFSKLENIEGQTISHLQSHPTKPCILVGFSSGCVQVWNYLGLKKLLTKTPGFVPSEEVQGLDEEDVDCEDENESDVGLGDDQSDTGSVSSRRSATSSVFGSVFSTRKSRRVKELQGMTPVSLLSAPKVAAQNHPEPPFVSTEITVDSTGALIAIVWQDATRRISTVAVYNGLVATTKAPPIVSSGYFVTSTRAAGPTLIQSLAHFHPMYETRWWLGSVAFHSFEPILFVTMMSEHSKSHLIYALSLRDRSLRTIDSCEIFVDSANTETSLTYDDQCAIPRALYCMRQSGDFVLSLGDKQGQKNTLLNFTISPSWLRECGTLSRPLMTPLSLPFYSYLQEGDGLFVPTPLREQTGKGTSGVVVAPSQAAVNTWLPISISIKPSLVLSNTCTDDECGPLRLSLDVFRVYLGNLIIPKPAKNTDIESTGSQNPSQADPPSVYLGAVDARLFAKKANKPRPEKDDCGTSLQWLFLRDEDHQDIEPDSHSVGGFFHPANIKIESISGTNVASPDMEKWYGIVTGSLAKGTYDPHQLKRFPSVCFLRFDKALTSEITAFRDAAFWSGSSLLVSKSVSSEETRELGALAICASGMKIVHLRLSNISEESDSSKRSNVLKSWDSPVRMQRVWTGQGGTLNVAVYASTPSDGIQSLYVTAPAVAFDVTRMPGFQLHNGERTLDVRWQPWSQEFEALQKMRLASGQPKAVCQLLGVLTNQRVIIMARDRGGLHLLNSRFHVTYPQRRHYFSRGNYRMQDEVTSITWADMCLVYHCISGAVKYLLPSEVTQAMTLSEHTELLARRSCLGMTVGNQGSLLCSLPRGLYNSSSVVLIAIAPDRLVYASVSSSPVFGTVGMCLCSRPCLPVEPLLLGLLTFKDAAAALSGGSTAEKFRHNENESRTPSPTHSTRSYGTTKTYSQRAGAQDQISFWKDRLGDIVEYCDKVAISLVMAYFPVRDDSRKDSGTKAPETQASRSLCSALLQRPEGDAFRELAPVVAGLGMTTNSASGDFPLTRWLPPALKFDIAVASSLPRRGIMELLSSHAEFQDALLGDDAYIDLPHPRGALSLQLSSYAIALYHAGFAQSAATLADIAGCDELLMKFAQEHSFIGEQLSKYISAARSSVDENVMYPWLPLALEAGATSYLSATDTLPLVQLSGYSRRRSLLPTGIWSKLPEKSSKVQVNCFDRARFDEAHRVQIATRSGVVGPSTRFGTPAFDVLEEWVTTRFALQSAADVGVESSALAELNEILAGDARYDHAGEILDSLPHGAKLPETWVTGVGEGREWDKLSLYCRFSDVRHQNSQAFRSSGFPGSRAVFLDLSRYEGHVEAFCKEPSSFTITLSESPVDGGDSHERTKALCDVRAITEAEGDVHSQGLRVPVPRGSPLDVGMYHVSSHRSKLTLEISVCFDGKSLYPKSSLFRREVGAAAVKAGAEVWELAIDVNGHLIWTFGTENTGVRTQEPIPDLLPQSRDDSPLAACGAWTHIAAVLDSSKHENGAGGTASFYINGECVLKGKSVSFTTFEEHELAMTTMYIGSNLSSGWRFTELRVWADVRTGTELEQNQCSMLSMASKRKRLQYRVKGNKQLFGPLDEQSFYLGGEASSIVTAKTVETDGEEVSVKVINSMAAEPKSAAAQLFAPLGPSPSNTHHTKPTLRPPAARAVAIAKGAGLISAPLPASKQRPVGLMPPAPRGLARAKPLR